MRKKQEIVSIKDKKFFSNKETDWRREERNTYDLLQLVLCVSRNGMAD